MSGKQMEGDNQRRRTLAREARDAGRAPSAVGATLGASKQPNHGDRGRRTGPRVATPAPVPRSWPRFDPTAVGIDPPPLDGRSGSMRYRQLVAEIARRGGLEFEQARIAAEATIVALARGLPPTQRDAFLEPLPAELYDEDLIRGYERPPTLAAFLATFVDLAAVYHEQARLQAQAVLGTLTRYVTLPPLPPDLQELAESSPVGGGVTGPHGGTAALSDAEVDDALTHLPTWTGDRRALLRTIELPPPDLDRALAHLETLKRRPHIGRQTPTTATLVVRTRNADAVTSRDVALAHEIDAELA